MKAQQITLIKGGHTYLFSYAKGREEDVLKSLGEMAAGPGDFDWIDAAMLSYQMGRRMEWDVEITGDGI